MRGAPRLVPQQLDRHATRALRVEAREASLVPAYVPGPAHRDRQAACRETRERRVHVWYVESEMVEALAVRGQVLLVHVGSLGRLNPLERHLSGSIPAEQHFEGAGRASVL